MAVTRTLPNRDKVEFPLNELVPIGALRPHPRNARTHSKKQIALIRQSIEKFGQIKPVIVDDKSTILAGHGFVEAAQLVGLTHVAIIRFGHLSDAQKRAYLIADNRIAEQAGWDREMLAIELGELVDLLPAEDLEVTLTGFAVPEIDLLLSDMAASKPEPEEALALLSKEIVSQQDDVWLLGKHRLSCGDARKPTSFVRLMQGDLATAVFCDPPYNVRVSSIGGRGRHRHGEFAFASGEMRPAQFRRFLSETLGNGIHVSTEAAVHFVCMDWRHIDDLIAVGRDLYDSMLNLVVWNKTNAGQGSFYRSQHELIGVFRTGGRPHRNNVELGRFGRNRSNVWTYAGANTFGNDRMNTLAVHPTVKPTALVADALLDCTTPGDIVLDQFAGSGTSILAAEKVGRVAYCLEYEPRYVDVAILRWQQMTHAEAILEGDGRTFEEMSQVRAKPAIHAAETHPDSIASRSTLDPPRISSAAVAGHRKTHTPRTEKRRG
ncbi:DNA methyltransferase [Bradyrhizobium sp. th.b2]|uniref:DNA methyltransferase n=1 Tax=Bradyrhizobium sp. th-b2 TaxID=172088 RepID=UPI0004225594|nr:DNA methyltransferase [Bradyrhizobium sp. th.b2]